jgi:hypothetical protein
MFFITLGGPDPLGFARDDDKGEGAASFKVDARRSRGHAL